MLTDGQGTKWRKNIAENFNRLSRAQERYKQTHSDRRQHRPIANVNVAKNGSPYAIGPSSVCMSACDVGDQRHRQTDRQTDSVTKLVAVICRLCDPAFIDRSLNIGCLPYIHMVWP